MNSSFGEKTPPWACHPKAELPQAKRAPPIRHPSHSENNASAASTADSDPTLAPRPDTGGCPQGPDGWPGQVFGSSRPIDGRAGDLPASWPTHRAKAGHDLRTEVRRDADGCGCHAQVQVAGDVGPLGLEPV